MKVSLVRRFVATAAIVVASVSTQAHAGSVTLAMEAIYDPANGNLSVRPYDSSDDSPWTGTDPVFGLFDINSSAGYFDGAPANLPPGSFVSGDTNTRINFAFLSGAPTISDASPWNFGNVVQAGLTAAQINNLISNETGAGPASFTWSLGAGNPNQVGRVVSAVPEPSTLASLGLGGAAILGYAGRRRLRRGLRKKGS